MPRLNVFRTIRRWILSGPQRHYEWQWSPHYWRGLRLLGALRFSVGRRIFGVRANVLAASETVSILKEIVATIAGQALLAVVLVGLLWPLETVFRRLGVSSWVLPTGIDRESYISILSTLAQVAGVFLGLYFTGISAVASTVYARVPGDVRSILTQEKVGNVYIRMVALLGAVSILLLALRAVGLEPGLSHLLLVALLGVVAVFSFVVLGTRAFNFFDPTTLVDYLARDLLRWMHNATPAGFQWRNAAFQAHYQRQAQRALQTYSKIVTLTLSEEHVAGGAVLALAGRALGLLQAYERQKLAIPTESHWFARRQRHRDWFTTDYTQVSIAIETGTALQPRAVPDPNWFEAYLEDIVVRGARTLIQRGDLESVVSLCDGVQRTLDTMSSCFAIDEAFRLFRSLGTEVRQVARTGDPDEGDPKRLALQLAVVDIHAMGLISILLGFSKKLGSITSDSFSGTIGRIRWQSPGTVYATSMPRAALEQLEHLQKGLELERRVEGRTLSPSWYLTQISALGMARFIDGSVNTLIGGLESNIVREAEALAEEGRHVTASQLIQRGLEACQKYAFHLREIRVCFERISALRRVGDIPWPTVDWEKVEERVQGLREGLVEALARVAVQLAAVPSSPDLPDYFGHAYATLAQESYAAMASGKEELFKGLFPPFFVAGLSAHDRLGDQLKEYDEKTRTVFSTEPIADLLDLSGYALIYSELDRKDFWGTVKSLWDKYFETVADAGAALRFVEAVVEYRRSLFAILPRDLARTAWKQDLERRLRERGLLIEPFERRFLRRDEPSVHPSPIIRALVRGGPMTVEDPEGVFIAVYVAKRPEAAGLELKGKAKSFARSLEREVPGAAEAAEDPL